MSGKRAIGPFMVGSIGLGCMSLSHAYGHPPARDDARRLLHHALDLGCDFLDTAALYGFGANEALIGETLAGRRDEFVLASKCGMAGVDGKRVIDGRPDTLLATIDDSLSRLRTDRIDLYYLHRLDPGVPIEDSVGAMARMVEAGKVRAIGLSEVSAKTLRRAHSVHPIAAVQTEYSLWTRNPEIAVLDACAEIGAAFVAFSPVGRGFLAGGIADPPALVEGDIRRGMPRFQAEHFAANAVLLADFAALAAEARATPAQLALGWLLARSPHIVPIPGTTSIAHLEENMAVGAVGMAPDILARAAALICRETISGPRYPDGTQAEIDTEEFA